MEKRGGHLLFQVHASTPVRINDIGGWTDTWFSEHGKVLNMAVVPGVEVRLKAMANPEKEPRRVLIHLLNYGEDLWIHPENPDFSQHALIHGAFKVLRVPEDVRVEGSIISHVPAGSSTGTSASVCVALLGALEQLAGKRHSPRDIAALAHKVETDVLGLQSGIQDQIAAACGGVCFIDMKQYPHADVIRLNLDEDLFGRLDQRLLLVYLGRAHRSSDIHQSVIKLLRKEGSQWPVLRELRDLADQAKAVLLEADLKALGAIMIRNTECQKRLHRDLVSEEAERVIATARSWKASGWKVNGAGGTGGSVTILASGETHERERMREELRGLGKNIKLLPVRLTRTGLTVRKVPEDEFSDSEKASF